MSNDLAYPRPVIVFTWPDGLIERNDNYIVRSTFYFRGTKFLGLPRSIQLVAMVDSATEPGDVRIYDLTNSQVIAEKTGIVDLVPTIIDMGVLSNLPQGPAIFEIQLRVTSLIPNDILLYSLALLF
jgi:hypothetical protein